MGRSWAAPVGWSRGSTDELRERIAASLAGRGVGPPGLRSLRRRLLARLLRAPGLRIGGRVRIDRSHPGLGGELRIGRHVAIGHDVVLDVSGGLVIEDEVTLSDGVYLLSHQHDIDDVGQRWRARQPAATPLRVGYGAWLGVRAVVLGSARDVGPAAVVGAGAVVTKPVAGGLVSAGLPSHAVRWRTDLPSGLAPRHPHGHGHGTPEPRLTGANGHRADARDNGAYTRR